MLRIKIMAVLSEGGSEPHTIRILIQKYKNLNNFPKTGPMELIFESDLDIMKGWQKFDVILTWRSLQGQVYQYFVCVALVDS